MTRKQNLWLTIAAAATATVSTFIGLPAIIFEGNQESFIWPLGNLILAYWPYMLVTSALLLAPAVLLTPKLGRIWAAATVAFAAYLWAHGVFQTHEFGSLDGVNFNPTVPFSEAIIEAVVIAGAMIAVGMFAYFRTATARVIILLPIVSLLIQTTPTLLSEPIAPITSNLTIEEIASLSLEANVVVILLDSMQSDVFESVVRSNAQLEGSLAGFTLYSDTVGAAPTTYLSMPTIHAGVNYHGEPVLPFFKEAVGHHSVLTGIVEAGYRGALVNTIQKVCPQRLTCISTRRALVGPRYEIWGEAATLLDLVLFRISPLGLKAATYNNGNWIFQSLAKDARFTHFVVEGNEFLQQFARSLTPSANSPQLRFLHLFATHPPFVMQEDCSYAGRDLEWNRQNIEQQVKCSLLSLSAVLESMKVNGVYDNSHIVIMSDHGVSAPGLESTRTSEETAKPLRLVMGQANPTLAIKPARNRTPFGLSETPLHIGQLGNIICKLVKNCRWQAASSDQMEVNANPRVFNNYYWKHEYWKATTIPDLTQFEVRGPLGERSSWLPKDAQLIHLDKPVFFSAAGSTSPIYGWHSTESWGTWSGSQFNDLFFSLPDVLPSNLLMRISAHAFVVEDHDTLEVTVAVNDQQVGIIRFDTANASQEIVFPVALSALRAGDGLVKITFQQDGIASPADFGLSSDERALGIGLTSITFESKQASDVMVTD